MFNAFKTRKPWAAAVIGLIFGPFAGMCYLYRGWIALAYFTVALIVLAWSFIGSYWNIGNFDPSLSLNAITLIGAAHCYYLAKKKPFVDRKWYGIWYMILLFMIGPIIAALLFRTFVYEPFNIPSGSMSPTMVVGDYFFADKAAYGYSRYSFPFRLAHFNGRIWTHGHRPQRGDVVVFKLPKATDIDYIKRIVGLPGDVVQMKGGRLFINDKLVGRELIQSKEIQEKDGQHTVKEYLETIPGGVQYHIYEHTDDGAMDNTPAYTVPEDNYFVLGDNRDNSSDSRDMKQCGFVPKDNITGSVKGAFLNENQYKWFHNFAHAFWQK